MTKAASIVLIETPVNRNAKPAGLPHSCPRKRPLSTILAAFLLLSLVACNGDDDNNNPAPPAPSTGSIQINTATSGGAPDADGYSIVVDGAAGQSIGTNATIVIANVAPGSRSVNLTGEANNCMASNNPRSVTVTAGATTPITFDVSCRTNTEILSSRPLAPTDRSLFVPRAYPDAPPLVPAQGTPLSEQQAQQALQDYLKVEFPNDVNAQNAAMAISNNPIALQKIPNPSLRAALAALMGTIGEPAIDFILNARTAAGLPKVTAVGFEIAGETIFTGPFANGAAIALGNRQTDQFAFVFTPKYASENPFRFTNIMAHEALHSDASVTDLEEVILLGLVDNSIYLEQLSRHPELALAGTELTRRANTNALARFNSGTGTQLGLFESNNNQQILPGSSAPFISWFEQFQNLPNLTETPGNPLLQQILAKLVSPGGTVPTNPNFSMATLNFIDQNSANLTPEELVAVAKALKLDIR